jgi:hypothetical protein
MNCNNIQEKLAAYLEGITSSEEKAIIDEHLKSCQRCREALADLEKTLEYTQRLEEMEVPQWLTQKVMARVKAEAEPKKGIFQKLFYPLHIKLPVEAVATVLIAIAAIYIFKAIQADVKFAKAPLEEKPRILLEEKDRSQIGIKGSENIIVRDKVLKQSEELGAGQKNEKGLPLAGTDRKRLFSEEKDKIHAFKEGKPVPAKPSEQNMLEKESEITTRKSLEVQVPAPTARQEERRLSVEAAVRDELKTEVLSRAPKEKASAEEKAEKISLTLYVKDVESAGKEIENIVIQLRGKIIKTESLVGKKVITVECDSKKINELIERLRLVGKIKEEGLSLKTLEGIKGIISIRIEIMSILTQHSHGYS